MEPVGALDGPNGASSTMLSLPAPSPWDEDEEFLGLEGIRPKSSPIPRRRSSESFDDSQPPPSSSRRVSFADAFGLSLVSVKQFDARDITVPADPLESDLNEAKEYYIFPLFALPQTEELDLRVHIQNIELENLELLPGTTTLRGVVRVLNLCFDKMVYVRTSLDSWRSHFDLLAEYVPGSHNGEMDCFSFKLTLVPPFGEEGARVDFCLRYDTSLGTFWANNSEKNYTVYCYEKIKEKPQNENENRRKSCLRGTSSALSTATTNNKDFPDIIVKSGQETSPELQKESKELMEEMIRNRSQRNRRKAARLAKVKEHFAQREEEQNEGTKTTGSEVTAESSMLEHASVLEKEPCSFSQQTPAGPPACNQITLSPAECLKSAECPRDSTVTLEQQTLEQDTVTNLSRAQVDSSPGDTDDLSDQTVSVDPSVPGCQTYDLCTGEDVEEAWKDFEEDAKQRIKLDEDANTTYSENVCLKTSQSMPQLFSHNYTFGTIVAPLYHQVFKNMETERKDFIQRAFQVDRTFREMEHGNLKAVTPPESNQTPMRQHTEITDGELNSVNKVNKTKNPPSDLPDIKHTDVSQNQEDPTNNQSKVENITLQTNISNFTDNLTVSICKHFPEESHDPGNIDSVVPQNDFNYSLSQSKQITSILNQRPETPSQSVISDRSLSTTSLEQTKDSYDLPEGPKPQTWSITMNSSDDKLPPVCLEMNFTNEKRNYSIETVKLTEPYTESENTQINTSNDLESYKINESGEQMTVDSQNSQPESCSTTDDRNHFDEEHDNTPTSKDAENIQKEELVTMNKKELCHISEGLVEEENRNQVMQKENQEVDEEAEEGAEEGQEAKEGGINNIADELRYIDDEEDINMGDEEIEKNLLLETANQQSDSVNQQSDSVNQQSDSVNQPSNSVNQQSESLNQQSDLDSVNQQSESVNQQSDLDSVHQQSLERLPEEQRLVIIRTHVESLAQYCIELDIAEEQQSTDQSQSEKEENDSKTDKETDTSEKESTQNSGTALSASMQGNKNDWEHLEFIDKDKNVCEIRKLQNEHDEHDDQENMECQSKDLMSRDTEKGADENSSTESLVDDEMELYLTCLRNSQQSVFREGMMNTNYSKRPSLSRGRSMSLTMPSISESVDEDQTNSSLENVSNAKDIMELERAMLTEGNVGRNVLWWKEFLSYDNMSRVIGYSFLLILFFIVAYYYDFIACFALYLLTVYWLFQQEEGESVKSSQRRGKQLQ